MPNLATALKEEITRLARKEFKKDAEVLKKSSAQYRRDIAALKRRVAALEGKVAFLQKETVSDAKTAVTKSGAPDKQVRFSAAWLRKHREKLGISAEDYGTLVGVSGQTVYNWEGDKSRPRAQQVAALATVRTMGKREAIKRLEMLAE